MLCLQNRTQLYRGQMKESKPGKLVHHSTYLTTPPEWLGPRFIVDADHLNATNLTGYRHEYLGEVVGSGNAVFENLRIEEIKDDQIKGFDRILSGVDWGWYPDPWAWNRMYYDHSKATLYIYDELTRNRTSNADTAKLPMRPSLKTSIRLAMFSSSLIEASRVISAMFRDICSKFCSKFGRFQEILSREYKKRNP